jgi:hypothetical protein
MLKRINWKERPNLQEAVDAGAASKWPVTEFLASTASFTFDGMARMVLEHEEVRDDGPSFKLTALPLPIMYDNTDFESKVGDCAAAVATAVERSVLGKRRTPKGEAAILGLCNHPKRFTTCGMNLERRIKVLKDAGWHGPYLQIINNPDGRDVETHELIERTIRSEHLDPAESVLIQLTPDCIEVVEGFKLQAVENEAGQIKVLCIRVPRIREDTKGSVGILHNCTE